MRVSLQQPNTFEDAIKNTVLAEVILSSQAANMPQAFIDGIKLEKISNDEYTIENAWEEDGKPLAVYFEYGTKDHYVKPKTEDGVLAFRVKKESSQRNPSAINYKSSEKKPGDVAFSKGHYVSGLPALMPMNRGFEIGIRRLKGVLEDG